jgi:hypothetical protein
MHPQDPKESTAEPPAQGATQDEVSSGSMVASGAEAWRPIETAPQDGYLLVHEDGAIRALLRIKGVWHKPGYPALVTKNYWGDAARVLDPLGYRLELRDGCCENPTHWMPLPQPPSARAQEPDQDERAIRRMLCAAVIGPLAYMDDGEASGDGIDFLRDSAAVIDAKMRERNLRRAAQDEPSADARDPLSDERMLQVIEEAGIKGTPGVLWITMSACRAIEREHGIGSKE